MRFARNNIRSKSALALLLIALPGIVHFIVFKYIPLIGNVIMFQDYNMFRGIWHSDWVGLKHFVNMFTYPEFYRILRNTLVLSLYSIVFVFPAPLALALLLNEIRAGWFKRPVQTVLYLPHFLSWVIVGGLFTNLLGLDGLVNRWIEGLGGGTVDFLTEPVRFRGLLVATSVWKEVGWGMIVYLAALTGINPNLYEAAMVDGAGRWRRMWHITLPGLLPAIVVLLLLRIGHVMDANVEQVLVFISPLTQSVGEVIDTYVYRLGLLGAQFSYTTAIGMFKSLIGFLLLVGMNNLSRKMTGESIY